MKEVYSKPANNNNDIRQGSEIFTESIKSIKAINTFGKILNKTLVEQKKAMESSNKFILNPKILRIRGNYQHEITLYEEALEGIKWNHKQKAKKRAHYKLEIKRLKTYIQDLDNRIAKAKKIFEKNINKDPNCYRRRYMRIIKITEKAIAKLKLLKKRANLTLKREEAIIEKLYKTYLHNIENPPQNPDKY